jgi:hypothetical protein
MKKHMVLTVWHTLIVVGPAIAAAAAAAAAAARGIL